MNYKVNTFISNISYKTHHFCENIYFFLSEKYTWVYVVIGK